MHAAEPPKLRRLEVLTGGLRRCCVGACEYPATYRLVYDGGRVTTVCRAHVATPEA